MRLRFSRLLLTRPAFWIGTSFAIAFVDLVLPESFEFFWLNLVLLPAIWQRLHRRHVPLVMLFIVLAILLPGIWKHLGSPESSILTARWWGLGVLASMALLHRRLLRKRRRQLGQRRELTARVRQRTRQLERANTTLRDEIARREETEHRLGRSETQFLSLVDRLGMQVLRKDLSGVIIFANEAFCRQHNRSVTDVVGCTDADLYPPALAQAYRADDLRVMSTGITVDHVEEHPAPEGRTGYVQVYKAPEYDALGNCNGIQVIFWDVTQKHLAEMAQREAFDALQKANAATEVASRAKSEFIAGVSHELRTPLGGIIGLSDLLAQTPQTPRAAQYVEMIRHSAQLLADVIEDILDFSAIEAGRLSFQESEIDVERVVGEAFKTVASRAINQSLCLIFSVDPHVARWVKGDAKRLRQIVVNIAGNAIKFTPSGEVHVRLSQHQSEIQIDFFDTGVGIAADAQSRVFEAFERGEASTIRRFAGTGLGLSISNALIQRMGGRIELESQPNQGSHFRCLVALPMTRPLTSNTLRPDAPQIAVAICLENQTLRQAIIEILRSRAEVRLLSPNAPSLDVEQLSSIPHGTGAMISDVLIMDATSVHSPAQPVNRKHSAERRKVIWIARLGEHTPSDASEMDVILYQPVLPGELLKTLNDMSERSTWSVPGMPPALAPDPAAIPQTPKDDSAMGAKTGDQRHRLLLVDDSEVNRLLLSDQLTGAGYQVDLASDGTSAIEFASQHRYQCVLMDLQLPDMDGTEATRKIHARYVEYQWPVPTTLAITAHVTDEHRDQCFAAGMSGFLTKPVDRQKLLAEIQRVFSIDHSAPASEPGGIGPVSHIQAPEDETPAWRVQLSRLSGSDPEMVRAICDAFVMEVPMLSKRLDQSLANNDLASAMRAAHTMKSCLRHVAPPEDVAVAAWIESETKAGRTPDEPSVHQLREIGDRWTFELRNWLKTATTVR